MLKQMINHPCAQERLVYFQFSIAMAVYYLLSGLKLFVKIATKQYLNVYFTIMFFQALACLYKVTFSKAMLSFIL